ncbi:(2E,6E)-farnesyl diphosphate synthase [soil metagenome]
MDSIADFFAVVTSRVDKTLDELIPSADVAPTRLHAAIRWSIFAGGKRIRPAILTAVGQVFGAEPGRMLKTAAAFEMIHTYSLIHDDLPAMDDDDLRRGKATSHKQFGEATAILAGDVLQTLAFKVIADDDSLSADTRVELISLLAAASGTPSGMVSGQQLDLDAEGRSLSIDEIELIHGQKTGALISAAALAGAMIGDASAEEEDFIRNYAEKLGLLFQITDDLLDLTQSTETLGKTAGKDIAAEKATYPSYFGIEKTRERALSIRDAACADLYCLEKETVLLREFTDMIISRTR